MENNSERAERILKDHRKSIDRLDAILIYTLGERFNHTKAVGKLKAEHNLPPSDPLREEEQIKRLSQLALEADLDPKFAKKFLVSSLKKLFVTINNNKINLKFLKEINKCQ